MNSSALQLTVAETATARNYWHMLLFPTSPRELHAARRGLKDESASVVEAVMDALAVVWDRDTPPVPEENPFV